MLYYKGEKLPRVSSGVSCTVDEKNVKSVKAWMRENKSSLDEYIISMLDKSSRDLKLRWWEIFKLRATYFDDCSMPVITISGIGSCHSEKVFIEAFTDGAQGTVSNMYIKKGR